MRQIVLLIALMLLAAAGMLVGAPSLAAQTPPQVQIGKLTFSTVAQWKDNPCGGQPRWATDSCNGLIISNNGDGELRLDQGSQQGAFTSRVVKADFPFNAIGAVWRASVPVSTTIRLEVRGGPTASEADLGAWQPLAAGDARSQSDDGALALESTRPFPLATAFFQLRATFDATAYKDREFLPSPALSEITLSYLDSSKGPTRATGLPRVPAPYGPATLTPPPQIVQRETWVAPASAAPIVRQRPTGIVLHQIGSDDLIDAPPFLRALAAYDTQVLGWDDLPFHFVVDRDGTIYAGRSGGPTAASTRFSGGDAAIHVALIGYLAPPAPQQEALTGLLAWLGQAYDIAPAGQHPVSAGSAAPADRPNIATHAEISRDAADNTDALRALVGPLRQSVDQATVRARWYFAEGNVLNFAERLAVLNPSAGP
ncbi:MAG TPA: peptidoglycan recognition family protein, partial [Roseiflexaceae bacterium]